ncbi:hypothetical protein M1307_01655 [Patescibacteria group bacterium]|jgi:hypothetical protein|nr:hypothetical protein [Patescibacteria group bacterium]
MKNTLVSKAFSGESESGGMKVPFISRVAVKPGDFGKAMDYLLVCEIAGMTFAGGRKPTELLISGVVKYSPDLCFDAGPQHTDQIPGDLTIGYGSEKEYHQMSYKIITLSEI